MNDFFSLPWERSRGGGDVEIESGNRFLLSENKNENNNYNNIKINEIYKKNLPIILVLNHEYGFNKKINLLVRSYVK